MLRVRKATIEFFGSVTHCNVIKKSIFTLKYGNVDNNNGFHIFGTIVGHVNLHYHCIFVFIIGTEKISQTTSVIVA